MPVVARCPSCGSALSEAAVLALAPVCSHCGSVLTLVGGTLGLTSAYGVNDASFTKRRLAADLAVIDEYVTKYEGMIHASQQQLKWSVERYAVLPPRPELLPNVEAPSGTRASLGPIAGAGCLFYLLTWDALYAFFVFPKQPREALDGCGMLLVGLVVLLAIPLALLPALVAGIAASASYLSARPRQAHVDRENRIRAASYEHALRAALADAEPRKHAEDYRLRLVIREAEGLLKTIHENRNELTRLGASL